MNTSFFIASKLAFREKKSFSSFIIKLAFIAVSLSVCIMIIGTAITQGYQRVIGAKFNDCWGHLHITNYLPDPSNLLSDEKINLDPDFIAMASKVPHVSQIYPYSIQSCISKSPNDMEGLLLKGINAENHLTQFSKYIIQGQKIQFQPTGYSNEILLSSHTAQLLNVKQGGSLLLYFLNKNEYQPKVRKVRIAGIFNTGLEDYDKLFAICDAGLIHSVNDDSTNIIQGYELYVDEIQHIKNVEQDLLQMIEAPLEVYPLEKRFANVFSWLRLMKTNEIVIVTIMLIIAIINMITAFLVLIMERTKMIGLLKSIGMPNFQIMKIFIFSSTYIVLFGALSGSIFAILLCKLQAHFGFIQLAESTYYIKQVPIFLNWTTVLLINLGTIFICVLLLFIPAFIIRKISPTKALLFN